VAMPATAARRAVAAAEGSSRSIVFRTWTRRADWFWERLHVRRNYHHLANRAHADAFAADFRLVAQSKMNDSTLAAVHRAEMERDLRFLHALGCRQGAHPQLFDAQDAVIVGVEADARMLVWRHPQRFHGQLLQREQQLGFVGEKQIDVAAAKTDQQIRVLEIGMRRLAFTDRVIEVKTGKTEYVIQEFFD